MLGGQLICQEQVPSLVDGLENALVGRDIQRGFDLLDRAFPAIRSSVAVELIPTRLLLCIAQWSDLGYRDISFLSGFMFHFSGVDRSELTLIDFLRLRMAEAYQALAGEDLEKSIEVLELVLRVGEGLLGDYYVFLANFWKGRAHRKRGDYETASHHIDAACSAAHRARAPKLVAVTKIHKSWLAFQDGKRDEALQLLDEAEITLRSTGHALSLGNIESARGRFVRRSGQYAKALLHFESAIAIYRSGCAGHPNLARALVNAAYVKRLIALDMQPKGNGGHARGSTHAKSLKVSREALDLLEQAGTIYTLHMHQGGTGSVFVNTAHVHLESGDIDEASIEGQRAYSLGEAKQDQILMARAMTVLSAVELARAEEQLGEQPDIALHANLAIEHADKAIELALQTQNKRLLAEAYIARGMAAASEYFQDWKTAKEYAGKATGLVSHEDRDHLYKMLSDLKSKLSATGRVEELLRSWSEGEFGNKTFQQIQEEFAELVIPKVWLKGGKNVTFVAKALAMSPKKVRRILRNARPGVQ